jgi:hypothetical protein
MFVGTELREAVASQMFGKPCFKINGKAFISFFQNEMVFKLSGNTHHEALALDGARLFDPSDKGRPMKEWVQVPFKHKIYWSELAMEAMKYVGGQ